MNPEGIDYVAEAEEAARVEALFARCQACNHLAHTDRRCRVVRVTSVPLRTVTQCECTDYVAP